MVVLGVFERLYEANFEMSRKLQKEKYVTQDIPMSPRSWILFSMGKLIIASQENSANAEKIEKLKIMHSELEIRNTTMTLPCNFIVSVCPLELLR